MNERKKASLIGMILKGRQIFLSGMKMYVK
jgi:hypothetical protein